MSYGQSRAASASGASSISKLVISHTTGKQQNAKVWNALVDVQDACFLPLALC
jgi:hypothetical protein